MDKKTILITNGTLSSLLALGEWIKKYKKEILAIFITQKLPSSKSNFYGIFKILNIAGIHYFYFKIWLNKILPLKIRLLGLPSNIPTFIKYLNIKIPIYYSTNINNDIVLLKEFNPDIIISFSATQKFSKSLISLPRRIGLNIHYSLLPKYAGLSPYFWCLYNDEKETGVTLHVLEKGLDTGKIILQSKLNISNIKTATELILKLTDFPSLMLTKFYDNEINEYNSIKQNLKKREYYQHPTKKQVKQFLKKGYKFMGKNDVANIIKKIKKLIKE